MDSFEINKIIASILLVALLIIGISKISNIIFKVDRLDSSAYKVELPDDGAKQISEENTMKSDDKVDKLPIFNKGLLGRRVALNLDGIIMIVLDINCKICASMRRKLFFS